MKAPAMPQKQWVLAKPESTGPATGQVNYENYGHAVAMPGPVLSSKTGNTFTPKLADLGKKKPVPIRRQPSGGVAGRGGQQSFFGQGSQPQMAQ